MRNLSGEHAGRRSLGTKLWPRKELEEQWHTTRLRDRISVLAEWRIFRTFLHYAKIMLVRYGVIRAQKLSGSWSNADAEKSIIAQIAHVKSYQDVHLIACLHIIEP